MRKIFILVLMVGLAACAGRQEMVRIDQKVNPECLKISYPAYGGIEIRLIKFKKGGEIEEEFGVWNPRFVTPFDLKYLNRYAAKFGCDCRFKQVGDVLVVYEASPERR